jgi:uracil-DNA glycosylase
MRRMKMRNRCECGLLEVAPFGSFTNIAIISDAPSFDDVKNGQAYTGQYGMALQNEMNRAGIQPSQCRMMTLWSHSQSDECEDELHHVRALKDLTGAKLVLMLGKECLEVFTGYAIGDVSGTIVKSKLLPKAIVVAGPSMSTLGNSPLGELRLALEVFAEQRRRIK